jgi:25S rRNA (uracil2634-N3)-methyltransferase
MPKLKTSIKNFQKVQKKIKQVPPPKKKNAPTFRYKLKPKPEEKILFIGEGNFSFALSLALMINRADNFVCTSYDSEETCIAKYPESLEILQTLRDLEAELMFNIDCKNIQFKQRFSKIIFNFPHVGLGIKDQLKNVITNQKMILAFFEQAKKKLCTKEKNDENDGEIIVSLKNGVPYDLWDIRTLAKGAGLALDRSFEFIPSDYKGYAHRRTLGYDSKISNPDNQEIMKNKSRTYVFKVAPPRKEKQ